MTPLTLPGPRGSLNSRLRGSRLAVDRAMAASNVALSVRVSSNVTAPGCADATSVLSPFRQRALSSLG